MLFISFEYALLLAMTAAAYWLVPRRFAMATLMIASIVFYATWSIPYLALVATSITIGYAGAILVERQRAGGAHSAMALVAVALLGLLAWFKYADFILEIWAEIFAGPTHTLGILLPLAISFYTFQILGYVIDVHRGTPAERSPFRFALFISFFPQLIAGPIARGSELIPQLVRRPSFDGPRVLHGLELIALGVVKKVVVADNLTVFVDRVYANPAGAGGFDALVAFFAFGAQIYCDFSGYTDIARGSGYLFGIELPENFRSPYLARSVTEFWRRWHITLSTWLRDYLYIPLGGNRRGRSRVYANLLITMGLGGLWHGASVTFVLWGMYHGGILALERVLGLGAVDEGSARGNVAHRLLRIGITFIAVQAGWVIFRAESLATLVSLWECVARAPLGSVPSLHVGRYLTLTLVFYAAHAIVPRLAQSSAWQLRLQKPQFAACYLVACVVLTVVAGGPGTSFIYFQF